MTHCVAGYDALRYGMGIALCQNVIPPSAEALNSVNSVKSVKSVKIVESVESVKSG